MENKNEQKYTIAEISKMICDSYEECVEGVCPGFDYCSKKKNGVFAWIEKIMNGENQGNEQH